MKKLLYIVLLVILIPKIQAQSCRVFGIISGENDEIINYANVTLLSEDSVFIDGILTDLTGFYSIQAVEGNYILQIKALGYNNISQMITIPNEGLERKIHMTANTLLNEVIVVAKTPLVKREADKIIFDANSVAAGSNDALDILKNVPGIIVSNDDIRILGQGGVKVLVNEKDTKMTGNGLLSLLKSYPAEQIDKIEVISAPPSRFDAEGSTGILNIKLKKIKNDYAGTTISYGHSYDKFHINDVNANFIYNKSPVNVSLNFGGITGKTQYVEKNQEEHSIYYRENTSEAINGINACNFRGNLEYQINKNILLGVLVTHNENWNESNLDGESCFYSNDFKLDSLLLSTNPNSSKTNNYRSNIYSDIKIDSLGKKIYFDIDYISSKYHSEKTFTSKTYDFNMIYIGGDYAFNNNNDREVNALTSSVDFILPFKSYTLSFGSKISLTETENKIHYYNQPSLEDQSNIFFFKEDIYALYVDIKKTLNQAFTLKTGLRLEYTDTKGLVEKQTNLDDIQVNKNNYTRLFPTLYLGYKQSEDHQFNFNFSSRVSRPSFRNINPFTLYTNKYSTTSGKHDLKPSYTYKLNWGYTLKTFFNFDIFYSYNTDLFTQVQRFDNETLMVNTFWDNVLDGHSIGINNSYFYDKLNWLQFFFLHGISYEKSYSKSIYTIPQRNTLLYVSMINTSFFFNKKKTLTGWVNASYTSPEKIATTDLQNTYNINIGGQYSLLNNKMKISLTANHIISSHVKGNINSNDFKMHFDNKYNLPTAKLSVTYIFGARLNDKRHNNSEIQNRL